MPLAPAGEIRALNGILTGVFISLHTGNPGNNGASEVSGNAYARQSASFNNSGSNPTVAANAAVIQFPQSTGDWGTITHFGIWSAATSGSYLGGAAVETAKPIGNGDIARWDVGTLRVEAD